jgi:hypothetical protein
MSGRIRVTVAVFVKECGIPSANIGELHRLASVSTDILPATRGRHPKERYSQGYPRMTRDATSGGPLLKAGLGSGTFPR